MYARPEGEFERENTWSKNWKVFKLNSILSETVCSVKSVTKSVTRCLETNYAESQQ